MNDTKRPCPTAEEVATLIADVAHHAVGDCHLCSYKTASYEDCDYDPADALLARIEILTAGLDARKATNAAWQERHEASERRLAIAKSALERIAFEGAASLEADIALTAIEAGERP